MNCRTSSLITNRTVVKVPGLDLQLRGLICNCLFVCLVLNYFCTVFCIYFSCSVVLGNNATLSERSVKPYMCMYKAYVYLYVSLLLESYSLHIQYYSD